VTRGKARGRSFGALFAAALAKQRAGRPAEAAALYAQAIRADRSVAEAHNNLGCALLALRRLEDAARALSEAVALRPGYVDALDTLVGEERIASYGVSVETCEEALAAIARPGTATVQIILNAFRRKPLDEVLPAAAAAGAGIIARVPLASGLLSGRYTRDSTFAADDHRSYNRHGEAFDVGETFSGVDFEAGVDAAREFAALALPGATPAQTALRWVIQQPGVTTVIPGARNAGQARQNSAAAGLPALDHESLGAIENLYDKYFRAQIHARW